MASWPGAAFAVMQLYKLEKSAAENYVDDELDSIFTHH